MAYNLYNLHSMYFNGKLINSVMTDEITAAAAHADSAKNKLVSVSALKGMFDNANDDLYFEMVRNGTYYFDSADIPAKLTFTPSTNTDTTATTEAHITEKYYGFDVLISVTKNLTTTGTTESVTDTEEIQDLIAESGVVVSVGKATIKRSNLFVSDKVTCLDDVSILMDIPQDTTTSTTYNFYSEGSGITTDKYVYFGRSLVVTDTMAAANGVKIIGMRAGWKITATWEVLDKSTLTTITTPNTVFYTKVSPAENNERYFYDYSSNALCLAAMVSSTSTTATDITVAPAASGVVTASYDGSAVESATIIGLVGDATTGECYIMLDVVA